MNSILCKMDSNVDELNRIYENIRDVFDDINRLIDMLAQDLKHEYIKCATALDVEKIFNFLESIRSNCLEGVRVLKS